MNIDLRKQILLHIFKAFGFFSNEVSYKGFIEPLKNDRFLLDKQLVFELMDGEKQERKVWAASTKVNSSVMKILAADINDGVVDFVLALQLDNFPPCVMQMSLDEEDTGCFVFRVEDKWIDAGTLMQARILTGIETLAEIYTEWHKLNDYEQLYKLVIDFLNYQEARG